MKMRPIAFMTSTRAPRHEDAGAAARRAGGIVERPKEAILPRGKDQRLALVEDVIAGGHHISAGVDHPAKNLLGDAEAAGGVLAVDGDEIDAVVGDQRGQPLGDRVTAGASDDVAEEEQSQSNLRQARRSTRIASGRA